MNSSKLNTGVTSSPTRNLPGFDFDAKTQEKPCVFDTGNRWSGASPLRAVRLLPSVEERLEMDKKKIVTFRLKCKRDATQEGNCNHT
jgi:hypothetical protein